MVECWNKSDSSYNNMLGTSQIAQSIDCSLYCPVSPCPLGNSKRGFFFTPCMPPKKNPIKRSNSVPARNRLSRAWQSLIAQQESLTLLHWLIKPVNTSVLVAITMICVAGLELLYKWLFPGEGKIVFKSMLVIEEGVRFITFCIFLIAEVLKNLGVIKK